MTTRATTNDTTKVAQYQLFGASGYWGAEWVDVCCWNHRRCKAHLEHLSIVRIYIVTLELLPHAIVVPELPVDVFPPKFLPLFANVGGVHPAPGTAQVIAVPKE